ncbi:Major facilitator-type transporter hxnP [Fusarium oxysporum f. sp. albedinis]|nr:Major facilitator-type transporter hxnP [Fusarium oxysporum f. sp. albedinis]
MHRTIAFDGESGSRIETHRAALSYTTLAQYGDTPYKCTAPLSIPQASTPPHSISISKSVLPCSFHQHPLRPVRAFIVHLD